MECLTISGATYFQIPIHFKNVGRRKCFLSWVWLAHLSYFQIAAQLVL